MKKLILDYKLTLRYFLIGIIFLIAGLIVPLKESSFWNIINSPFNLIADLIRNISRNRFGNFCGYLIYIVVSIMPLIYWLINIIKYKKINYLDIIFIPLSIYLFFVLYYFINPHLLPQNHLIGSSNDYFLIYKSGIAMTFYLILLIYLLSNFFISLNKNNNNVYRYAKILIDIIVFFLLFLAFYLTVVDLKSYLAKLPSKDILDYNYQLNVLVKIINYLFDSTIMILVIVLIYVVRILVDKFQKNFFENKNVYLLKRIIIIAKILIIASLIFELIKNILNLIFANKLLNTNFSITISIFLILAVCFTIIISKILIKAIEINEENKMVI